MKNTINLMKVGEIKSIPTKLEIKLQSHESIFYCCPYVPGYTSSPGLYYVNLPLSRKASVPNTSPNPFPFKLSKPDSPQSLCQSYYTFISDRIKKGERGRKKAKKKNKERELTLLDHINILKAQKSLSSKDKERLNSLLEELNIYNALCEKYKVFELPD